MKINNRDLHNTDILQYIRDEKEKTCVELRNCSQRMKSMTSQMFEPPVIAGGRTGTFLHLFSQGVALYKGVTLGLTVVRGIRRLFRK